MVPQFLGMLILKRQRRLLTLKFGVLKYPGIQPELCKICYKIPSLIFHATQLIVKLQ
jgi:hypothetical protein